MQCVTKKCHCNKIECHFKGNIIEESQCTHYNTPSNELGFIHTDSQPLGGEIK